MVNELCFKASLWQDHPLIAHDEVHLFGNLDVFYPNWATPFTLPDDPTIEEIIQLTNKHMEGLCKTKTKQ